MCVRWIAWLCLLLGLLPLEIQSQALTQSLSHRHRWSLPRSHIYPKSSHTTIMPPASNLLVATDNQITHGDRNIIWGAMLHKEHPPRLSDPSFDQSNSVLQKAPVWHRGSRGRRHAINGVGRGHGHGHLMRVGCVLGTCQVQNLSHRLYQLIGQSGREDSSPINPRSPHSYG